VRLALKLNRELLRATSCGYITIPIAVISTIITVIDHSTRGMRHGCDRTLAREAHASHVLAASRRARNLLHDKRAQHSRPRSRKAIRVKVLRRDRRYGSGVSRSREVIGARKLMQFEQDCVRSRPSRREKLVAALSIDLSMRDSSVRLLLPHKYWLAFFLPPFDRDWSYFSPGISLFLFFINFLHPCFVISVTLLHSQVEILKYLRDWTSFEPSYFIYLR